MLRVLSDAAVIASSAAKIAARAVVIQAESSVGSSSSSSTSNRNPQKHPPWPSNQTPEAKRTQPEQLTRQGTVSNESLRNDELGTGTQVRANDDKMTRRRSTKQ